MITSEVNTFWPVGHEKRTLTVYDSGRRYTVFSGSGQKLKEWTQVGVAPLTAEEIAIGLQEEGARIAAWQRQRIEIMDSVMEFAKTRFPNAEISRGWKDTKIYSPEEIAKGNFEGPVLEFDIAGSGGLSVVVVDNERKVYEWVAWLSWRGL